MAARVEARLDSLDKAFLFLIGTTNTAFVLLQTALNGIKALLLFAPLLVTGLFFPFYIRYLGGAIAHLESYDYLLRWRRYL